MNEDQKNARVEMECLSHEAKMMKEAKLKRLKDAPLKERMQYIMSLDTEKKDYSAVEMSQALVENGLMPPLHSTLDIADFMRENFHKV